MLTEFVADEILNVRQIQPTKGGLAGIQQLRRCLFNSATGVILPEGAAVGVMMKWCVHRLRLVQSFKQRQVNVPRPALADALAFGMQVIRGDRAAADHGIGMVKEAGNGFVTDLAGAPEATVADECGDNGARRLAFGFVCEFFVETDSVHCRCG